MKDGVSPNKVKAIYGGVSLKEINKVPSQEKKYDGCFVGRLHPQKGPLELVKIWSLVCKVRENAKLALIGCLIFYSQLTVGWLSTTAYVDLVRTFFEILALDYFLKWAGNKKLPLLIKSSVLVGLAISVKLLAFYSLASFIFLILICLALAKSSEIEVKTIFL